MGGFTNHISSLPLPNMSYYKYAVFYFTLHQSCAGLVVNMFWIA